MTRFKKKIISMMPKIILGYVSNYIYRPFKSYSGEGEDCVIQKIFSKKNNGVYVDVGCFHPVVVSNTYILYKKGWRGINIDVDQYKIDIFNKFRKNDKNICVAISDRLGEVEFFFQAGESYGSMSGLIKSEVERRAQALGRTVLSRMVPTMPLSDIIENEKLKRIDFLSVDVEGAEEIVISTIDFNYVEIDVIAVEIHGDFSAILNSNINKILKNIGYDIIAWTPPTVFYRKPSSTVR